MRVRYLMCATTSCAVLLSGCSSQVPPGSFIGDHVGAPAAAAATGQANGTAPSESTSAAADLIDGASPGAGQPGHAGQLGAGSTGSADSTGSGSTPGGTGGSGTTGGSAAQPPASAGITAASCAGFRNQLGISNSSIDLANVADISGPVPGLFTSAQQAALAYAAYFNSTSTICGRKLKVNTYDSQTSATGDQQAATSACDSSFAMVASVSAFDNGGAGTVAQCGIPDLRTIATNPERFNSPVSFGTDAVDPTQVSTAQYRYIKSVTGAAAAKSAMLYLDAGASAPNALAYKATMEHVGYHFVYTKAIGVTEFNYAPYAADLKRLGVTLVQFEGSYQFAIRLKQAMAAQGVSAVFVMDSVAYDPVFVQAGGSNIDGMYSYVDSALIEEASRNPELQLYTTWLHRVAPLAKPTFFGMFAWGAMALFSQLALQLGGKLTRSTLLTAIKAVHSYTDHGLFTAQDVGGKTSPGCQAVIQLEDGVWKRRSPYPYSCSDVFDTVAS